VIEPQARAGSVTRAAQAEGMFAALRAPDYPKVWLTGWVWTFTRWMAVFLASYLVTEMTGSPLLVQIVGAAFFAPMFLGGLLGGVVADRLDRRRTLMNQLAVLIPITALMGIVVLGGSTHVWMIYLFMLLIGVGGLLDMTSRRALIYDLVGAEGITNAMALEAMSLTGGNMLGSLAGGAIINFIGLGQAFFVMAGALAVAWASLAAMRPVAHEHTPAAGASIRADIAAGFRYARGHRTIVSILGVTVLMNFFFFPYSPMVPVFADRLGVNAFWTGVLASGTGFGALIGASVIAARSGTVRRGWTYMGGTGLAMIGLFAFAAADWYPAALLGLIVAGVGQSGFASMQASLMLLAAEPAMRGRAMGVLSMGIGVLPFGMVLLGVVAQLTSPPAAVLGAATLGFAGLIAWAVRSRDLRAIR
jgi:predicted MFS family arabinose efflux permease